MIVMHEKAPSVRQRTRLLNQSLKIAGLAWSLLVSSLLLVMG
jgi:hypothetical protein